MALLVLWEWPFDIRAVVNVIKMTIFVINNAFGIIVVKNVIISDINDNY